MELVLFSLGLGLAGFDIFGALIILTALGPKAAKREIIIFSLITLLGTIVLGTVATLLLGEGIHIITDFFDDLPDALWVVLDFSVVILLFAWAGRRIVRTIKKENVTKEPNSAFSKHGSVAVGVLYAISAFTDPSFLALIALSSREDSLIVMVLAQFIWILVSQSPLFALAIAVTLGVHERFVNWFNRVRKKYSHIIATTITVLILLFGTLITADLVIFLATGRWLLG